MFDLLYLALTLALFLLVAMAAKGAERIGAPARRPARREAVDGGERG
ncbi:hypothetical protein [Microbacterium resistens]